MSTSDSATQTPPMNEQLADDSGPLPGRTVIEIKDLKRVYRMGTNEVHALAGVDLTIREGEFIAIVGPSGSGKSTLMYILGLLDRPTGGSYKLDDIEVSTLGDARLSALRNRAIGYVFQQYHLLPELDVLDNIALGLNYAGVDRDQRREAARELATAMGLGERMTHTPRELSGGQMQRVAVARGLSTKPRLILADEPTGNLDSKTGAEIMKLFRRLHAAGHTVVLVTHDNEVAEQAERVVRIVDGHIVSDEANQLEAVEFDDNSASARLTNAATDPFASAVGTIKPFDLLRIAIREGLLAHKLRSFLTMLGIVFGIASVIAMTAITEGGKQQQLEQIRQIGLNNIQIRDLDLDGQKLLRQRRINSYGLTRTDLHQITDHVTGIDAWTAWRGQRVELRREDRVIEDITVLGVVGDFERVTNFYIGQGRFLLPADEEHYRRTCVIGHTIAERLGIGESPENQTVIIGDEPFTVVGVMGYRPFTESEVADLNITNRNLEVYIPLATMDAYFAKDDLASELDAISLRMDSDEELLAQSQLIGHIVGELHNAAEDHVVAVPLETIKQAQRTKEIFNIIIVVIAAMAWIVGGIGIMNIMLANVTERTKEIGIRRAIGASRRDILAQFLTESAGLSAIGGVIGLIIGVCAGFMVELLFGFPVAFSTVIMTVAVGVSAGIGIAFGLYPAYKAAHMDPVDALRV